MSYMDVVSARDGPLVFRDVKYRANGLAKAAPIALGHFIIDGLHWFNHNRSASVLPDFLQLNPFSVYLMHSRQGRKNALRIQHLFDGRENMLIKR